MLTVICGIRTCYKEDVATALQARQRRFYLCRLYGEYTAVLTMLRRRIQPEQSCQSKTRVKPIGQQQTLEGPELAESV
jgi:hypothetical protein